MSQAELDLYREKFTSGERQLKEAKEKQASIQKDIRDKKTQIKGLEQSLPTKTEELVKAEFELKVNFPLPSLHEHTQTLHTQCFLSCGCLFCDHMRRRWLTLISSD